ncbi:Mss4-like protein [Armillaria novae-zelandiae]|uniref:Mss4-like protein n=1 Tax=Armillaria novae-zelandiae TaxID=153914 RepID=A0AA39PC02_9AGAR|nr:Mss4-like protein [Armillaria novae-zelandiae]
MSRTSTSEICRGGCYCGQISYTVTGKPTLSAYCHCTQCQSIKAAAFSHTIHFPGSSFSWTHNAAMDVYHRKPGQDRYRCANCGTVVACHNAENNEWSVYGGQMERDEAGKIKQWELLKPTAHIFYDTRMLDVLDDLGKWDGYENSSNRIS